MLILDMTDNYSHLVYSIFCEKKIKCEYTNIKYQLYRNENDGFERNICKMSKSY